VLHAALAVRRPSVDAEGKMRPRLLCLSPPFVSAPIFLGFALHSRRSRILALDPVS
jgi:hypothetical protein